MNIPEILLPLIARNVVSPEGLLIPLRDSFIYEFDDGVESTVEYTPDALRVWLVYGMTCGIPRDVNTGDALTTDEYGFWMRHGQMTWHFNPAVESSYVAPVGHWLELTRGEPLTILFQNHSGLTIIQDFTVWILEAKTEKWEVVSRYLRGIFRERYALGHLTLEGAKEYIDARFQIVTLLRQQLACCHARLAAAGQTPPTQEMEDALKPPPPKKGEVPWWDEIDLGYWWKE